MSYSAIVRLALTYRLSIWAETGTAGKIYEKIVKPLKNFLRPCSEMATGAYNSTSN